MSNDLQHRREGEPRPSLPIPVAPDLPEDGFDLVEVLQGWLKQTDLKVLARRLGYNNIVQGASHLARLRDLPLFGLDQPKRHYDLRYTSVELISQLFHGFTTNQQLIDAVTACCVAIPAHAQQIRRERSQAKLRFVTDQPPYAGVNSIMGGLWRKTLIERPAPSRLDYPADQLLTALGQQIKTHYQQHRQMLESLGNHPHFEYYYCTDATPIDFDIDGHLVDPAKATLSSSPQYSTWINYSAAQNQESTHG